MNDTISKKMKKRYLNMYNDTNTKKNPNINNLDYKRTKKKNLTPEQKSSKIYIKKNIINKKKNINDNNENINFKYIQKKKNKSEDEIYKRKMINPWVRLYKQRINNFSKRIKQLKETLEEEQEQEDLQLTFKPKINKHSLFLVEKNKNKEKIENKLLSKDNKIIKKLFLSKRKGSDEYKYRPKLNKETEYLGKLKRKERENDLSDNKTLINPKYIEKSNQIVCKSEINSKEKNHKKNNDNNLNEDHKINNIILKNIFNLQNEGKKANKKIKNLTPNKKLYDFLYLEKKILEQKRKKEVKNILETNYPFKPKLNKSFNKKIKSRYNNISKNNDYLKNLHQLKLTRNIKNELDNPLISKTYVKPYFTKVEKKDHLRYISEENDKSFSNILNESIKKSKLKENIFKNSNKKQYLKNSYNIILNVRKIKYKELFNTLDSDKDGFISSKKIKLSEIDNQKLISLTPILKKMQYQGLQMDLDMFVEEIEKIK